MSCPVCNVSLTNSNLLTSVKPDIVLQDIVDKLLPGLQTCERQSFVEFSKEDNSPKPITQFCNYKMITVYLDWVGSELCSIPVKDLECNFIRTSNKATISHFAQFVMDKLARDPRNERCEIMCGGVTLPTIFTLEMLIENNLDFETKRGFVHLQYDILGHT
uniref:Uncharacterized protein n=1 Tax=Ciona savignyi TaxID=51511 RepID=H2Z0V9_CIOSA